MRVIAYNPGRGGNNPQQVLLDESSVQPFLLGSQEFAPAGFEGPCVWMMIVNEGQGLCCPRHQGLVGAAMQAMDLEHSMAAVSHRWRLFKPAPVRGKVHDFVSPVLIPASEVSSRTDLPLMAAAELLTKLTQLKDNHARRTGPRTHLHIAVMVDRLPVVPRVVPPTAASWWEAAAAPAPTATASAAGLLEVDEASSMADLQRSVDVLQRGMAALQLQLQQVTSELAAAKAAGAAEAADSTPAGSTRRGSDSDRRLTDAEVEGFAVVG